jgi:hypothetical protein
MRRTQIVEYMIKLRADDEYQDLHLWKWLAIVLEHLGAGGMSLDESSAKTFETVYRVKSMPWRRDIVEYMDIIDHQCHKDSDIFNLKGSKPIKRVCRMANPAGRREPVHGLPCSFYDDDWFKGLDEYHQSKLQFTNEKFEWPKIVATHR